MLSEFLKCINTISIANLRKQPEIIEMDGACKKKKRGEILMEQRSRVTTPELFRCCDKSVLKKLTNFSCKISGKYSVKM